MALARLIPLGWSSAPLASLPLAASSAAGKSMTAKIRLEITYYGYDSSRDRDFTRVAYLECASPGGDVENPKPRATRSGGTTN
jgi:hypothetical protein